LLFVGRNEEPITPARSPYTAEDTTNPIHSNQSSELSGFSSRSRSHARFTARNYRRILFQMATSALTTGRKISAAFLDNLRQLSLRYVWACSQVRK
jgi:hypothetical protein